MIRMSKNLLGAKIQKATTFYCHDKSTHENSKENMNALFLKFSKRSHL